MQTIEQLEKHNRQTHINTTSLIWSSPKILRLRPLVQPSVVTSLLYLQEQSFTKCELKLSLNTTNTKQQEFFLNPSSLSMYTDSFSHSLFLSSLCLSTTCLCLLSSVAFKPIGTVCSFPLLGSLALDLFPLKSTLSVKQSWHNVFREGDHLFCNGRDHRAFEIPKKQHSLFTQRNTLKPQENSPNYHLSEFKYP